MWEVEVGSRNTPGFRGFFLKMNFLRDTMHTSSLSALLQTTKCQSSGTEMLNMSMWCRNRLLCPYSAPPPLCVSVNAAVAV